MGRYSLRALRGQKSTKEYTEPSESPQKTVTTPIVDSHMEGVSEFFSTLSQTEILEYCLGYDKHKAPGLAADAVLIAVNCHSLEKKPHPLLEIGIHFISRKGAKKELANPGPHSLNLLRRISYRHIIIEDNACHANLLPNPQEAETNHFGATRFVRMEDAKDVLEQMFRMSTMTSSCNVNGTRIPRLCPLVLLNYDLPQWPTLQQVFSFDPSIGQNMVATISTKHIAYESGDPWSSAATTLSQLTEELNIEYPAKQSAADHAAYTLIDAVQLAMRPKMPLARESIRSVVNTTMLYSQSDIPLWGYEDLCTLCGEQGHRRLRCHLRRIGVECWKCTSVGRQWKRDTHTSNMCPFF